MIKRSQKEIGDAAIIYDRVTKNDDMQTCKVCDVNLGLIDSKLSTLWCARILRDKPIICAQLFRSCWQQSLLSLSKIRKPMWLPRVLLKRLPKIMRCFGKIHCGILQEKGDLSSIIL